MPKEDWKQKEIGKVKEVLKKTNLRQVEKVALESYVKSLEKQRK